MLMHLVVLMLANLLLAGAPSPDPEDQGTKDLKQMQGTWLLVTAEQDGKPSGKEKSDVRMVIKDKSLTITEMGDKEEKKEAVTIKLDGAKKPRHIDMTVQKGDHIVQGIYSLTGEELKICFQKGPEGKRPTELSSKGGYTLLVFKKMKP